MKKILVLPLAILGLAFLFVFVGCQSSSENSGGEEPPTEAENSGEEQVNETAVWVQAVVYESAAVYAGRTDYIFRFENGAPITVGVSNLPEDADLKPKMPDNLLESEEGLDGPPGANPEMIGKTFQLIYEKGSDYLMEIRLFEG